MRLEPRAHAPLWLQLAAPVGAALAALVITAVPLSWAEAPVLTAYAMLAQGALGSGFALTETLTKAAPLILTGLAAAIAFRARLWNIGAEGQLYAGALAAVMIGSGTVVLSPWLMVPLVLVAGALAGALLMLGPTLLKVRLGVDEVVTTLLLNFIMLLFVQMMVEGPLQDPMSLGWPQSMPIIDEAALPRLVERTRLHIGLIVALVAALAIWLTVQRTTFGFEVRAVGANPHAARFAGMSTTGVMVRVGLLSGALAGLAGVGEVAGLKGFLTQDLSPGYGYSGIVVAMLAQLNPLGVVLAALFVAGVFVGADSMSRAIGVSNTIADLIVAIALLTMLVASLVIRYRVRFG
ncbi:MAG: ABC transporter permease [Alphaproteobacteria bacterium]|jgi:simple sugar transport system permease protein|nr:ABC transporter permease [Alphaproteobacteria bacterium]